MSPRDDGSDAPAVGQVGSWGQWLPVGLAVAAALAWLASALTTMAIDWDLLGAALMYLAVPAVGVWLASRRHGPMGLAVIATWAGLVGLPALVWWATRLGISGQLFRVEVLVWSALAVAALGTALRALVARSDHRRLGEAGRRKSAAVAVAVWGLAIMGGVLIRDLGPLGEPGTLLGVHNVWPFMTAVVILTVAVVVWRRDHVAVVAAVLVVTVGALATVFIRTVRLVNQPDMAPADHTAVLVIALAALLVQVAAAAGLAAGAARLTMAART